MARWNASLAWFFIISLTSSLVVSFHGSSDEDRKVYIVYMGDRLKGESSSSTLHNNMLREVVGSDASDYLLRSYHRSFNGFAANLTEEEMQKLAGGKILSDIGMQGVVSVFPSQKMKLHTTKSWDFMGFPVNIVRSNTESDIIIGVLDTGIWPESQSFDDSGYGPPPAKWKGLCQSSSNFTCNNKIIGAKYYYSEGQIDPNKEFDSPRDSEGHGTHVASTAAGDIVTQASLLGLGSGIARGGVPSARIAVYKICWLDGCSSADILAAFDDAIADGVDIISLSIGGWPMEYFDDPIAIGAFHSMKNGILTSNSAGNAGPDSETVSNCSPWSLSVAASTINRKFLTPFKLGNGEIYQGNSLNTFQHGNTVYSIIYAGNASNDTSRHPFGYCSEDSLDKTLVEGKIVVCEDFDDEGSAAIGVAGLVSLAGIDSDFSDSYVLPVSLISSSDQTNILIYMNSTSEPTAIIFKSVEQKDELAPYVVSFSSRGPNPVTSDILKPDLTAPGVDILAAWSEATTVTGLKGDTRIVPYNIISGTSMACPHASAAAAYVKSFHPTWSPGAIKSALMTTAYPMNPATNIDQEFAYGSGHINPAKSIDPGLVYDAEETDYVNFLCGQGYNVSQLRLVTGDSSTCSEETNATVWDLNYPSFASSSLSGSPTVTMFHRTVTNVGSPSATYKAITHAPAGLKIQVDPDTLTFTSVGEKQSFVVILDYTLSSSEAILSGELVWDDESHRVRSPIVAFVHDLDV